MTGKRGIQVWIPVRPGYTFDETRAWTERLSKTIGKVQPDLVSWKWEKKDRGGLARLDYTQNAINKTLVAPYSHRGRRPARPSPCRSAGASSTTRTCGRTGGRSGPSSTGSTSGATRSGPCSASSRTCRRSPDQAIAAVPNATLNRSHQMTTDFMFPRSASPGIS